MRVRFIIPRLTLLTHILSDLADSLAPFPQEDNARIVLSAVNGHVIQHKPAAGGVTWTQPTYRFTLLNVSNSICQNWELGNQGVIYFHVLQPISVLGGGDNADVMHPSTRGEGNDA